MIREKVYGRFGHEDAPRIERNYGLGLSDVRYAEEMGNVTAALKRGTFGSFATVQEWVDWNVHPAWQDDAMKIVADYEREACES